MRSNVRALRAAFLFVVVATTGVSACATAPKLAAVTPGPMPEGVSWSGVYDANEIGELHVARGTEADAIEGIWLRKDQTRAGRFSGTQTGNVVRFRWGERSVDRSGPSVWRSGHGYFVYAHDGDTFSLRGELGEGEDEVGRAITLRKRADVEPNVDAMKRRIAKLEGENAVPDPFENTDRRPLEPVKRIELMK